MDINATLKNAAMKKTVGQHDTSEGPASDPVATQPAHGDIADTKTRQSSGKSSPEVPGASNSLVFRTLGPDGFLYHVDGAGFEAPSVSGATPYPFDPGKKTMPFKDPAVANLVRFEAIAPLHVVGSDGMVVHLRWGATSLAVAASTVYRESYAHVIQRLGFLRVGRELNGHSVPIRYGKGSKATTVAPVNLAFVLPEEGGEAPLAIRAPNTTRSREIVAHLDLLGMRPHVVPTLPRQPGEGLWTWRTGEFELRLETGCSHAPQVVALRSGGRLLIDEKCEGQPFADLYRCLWEFIHLAKVTPPSEDDMIDRFNGIFRDHYHHTRALKFNPVIAATCDHAENLLRGFEQSRREKGDDHEETLAHLAALAAHFEQSGNPEVARLLAEEHARLTGNRPGHGE